MSELITIGEPPAGKHHLYDSMSKMLLVFFGAVTKEPINYGRETTLPKPLVVSVNIFRGFTCPEHCGACCGKATLDYIPGEPKPAEAVERKIIIGNKTHTIYSDPQVDHDNFFCRHLDANARCGAYEQRPFSCDFALLNVSMFKTHSLLSCRKFGRHHLWKRIDMQRGTMCDMLPPTDETVAATRRRLSRLQYWVNYFSIDSWMPEIMRWASQDPYKAKDLRLGFGQ